jgi:hypothetical protein
MYVIKKQPEVCYRLTIIIRTNYKADAITATTITTTTTTTIKCTHVLSKGFLYTLARECHLMLTKQK